MPVLLPGPATSAKRATRVPAYSVPSTQQRLAAQSLGVRPCPLVADPPRKSTAPFLVQHSHILTQ